MKKAFATTKKAEAVEVAALPRRLRNVVRAEKRKEKTHSRERRRKELCAFRSHADEREEEQWCENHNVDARYRDDHQEWISDWGDDDYDWSGWFEDVEWGEDVEPSLSHNVRIQETLYWMELESRIYDSYRW